MFNGWETTNVNLMAASSQAIYNIIKTVQLANVFLQEPLMSPQNVLPNYLDDVKIFLKVQGHFGTLGALKEM